MRWAKRVVQGLSKGSPPYWIWRDKFAIFMRLLSRLPLGTLDQAMKRGSGRILLSRDISSSKGHPRDEAWIGLRVVSYRK
ncbi:hypothetical protein BDW71DRAFT_191187 [Aspergillus fruticulosus]